MTHRAHLTSTDAYDFGLSYDLDIRSLCGTWIDPSTGAVRGAPPPAISDPECGRCLRSLTRLARAAGEHL